MNSISDQKWEDSAIRTSNLTGTLHRGFEPQYHFKFYNFTNNNVNLHYFHAPSDKQGVK